MRLQHFTKYDVAFFIDERGKTRWSHLLKEFVENDSEKHISRQRLSNYLKELVDEGLVKKTVDPKALMFRMYWRVYPIYIVPKKRKKRLRELKEKKEIYKFIDSANPQQLKELHKEINRLTKEKNGN